MLRIKRFCFLVLLLGSISTKIFSQEEMCITDLVVSSQGNGQVSALINEFGQNWQNGEKIRVKFLDGNEDIQNKVIQYAEQWEQYANIDFVFGNFADADIKITFKDTGYWSHVGVSSRFHNPSMSLSGLSRNSGENEISRVVLHEFGHALGLKHEHQNIKRAFEWNETAVYERFSGPPNNWSREKIYNNVIKMYGDNTKYTNYSYDPTSIMHYAIPASLTKNGYSVGWNTFLSSGDKEVIGKTYPSARKPPPSKKIIPSAISYATLLSRRKYDDYPRACFSFEFGGNGAEVEEKNRNDWDILFGNGEDIFSVTMVVDDQSRIADLGELNWDDSFEVPVLPAHPKPAREPDVKAIVGHLYVVHTKDTETDFYALFRVESLEAGDKVTISWKRIPAPE